MKASRFLGTVLALSLFASTANAEFRSGPHVATVGIGPAFLDGGLGTGLYLGGRFDLGTLTDRLVWDAGLHWWKKSESTRITAYDFFGNPIGTTTTETRARDLALYSGVKYELPISSPKAFPYLRGGLGLNFVDVSVEAQGLSLSANDTDLGIYLGGGVQYLVSRGLMIGGELAYHATDADHTLLGVTLSFPLGHHFSERRTGSSSSDRSAD